MDEIGHFDLGSQVILALPKRLRILPKEGAKMFVGDPLAQCVEWQKSVGADFPQFA
jgi:hypothetical protein